MAAAHGAQALTVTININRGIAFLEASRHSRRHS
jgi:hypothetical protein